MTLAEKLKEVKNATDNDLKIYVVDYILDNCETDDDIKMFFSDLMNGGCQGGMIGELVYYADTAKFYDKFYDEIEELRENLEFEMGEAVNIKGDLKNWFAWFGFEEMTKKIADEVGVEI